MNIQVIAATNMRQVQAERGDFRGKFQSLGVQYLLLAIVGSADETRSLFCCVRLLLSDGGAKTRSPK